MDQQNDRSSTHLDRISPEANEAKKLNGNRVNHASSSDDCDEKCPPTKRYKRNLNDSNKRCQRSRSKSKSDTEEQANISKSPAEPAINENVFTAFKEEVEEKVTPIAAPDAQEIPLPQLLDEVISYNYLNVSERLKLQLVPVCVRDPQYCRRNHHNQPIDRVSNKQQADLQAALAQKQVVLFLSNVRNLCERYVFPGENIFNQLFEQLLFEPASPNAAQPQLLENALEVFLIVLRTFPPCCTVLRPLYLNFISSPLLLRDNSGTQHVLLQLLELLRDFLQRDDTKMEVDETGIETVREQDLELERLFLALKLLASMLEYDFSVWALKNYQNPSAVYAAESCPLVVKALGMQQPSSSGEESNETQLLYELFASCVGRQLKRQHLQTLERFLSLAVNVSFSSEMRRNVVGIIFPCQTTHTARMVERLYNVFKTKQMDNCRTLLLAIDLFHCPLLCYEFIRNVLQACYISSVSNITPKKFIFDFVEQQWNTDDANADEAAAEDASKFSKTQQMQLLLKAVGEYCDERGLTQAYLRMKHGLAPLKLTVPVHDAPIDYLKDGQVFDLPKMRKNVRNIEQKLPLQVELPRAKGELVLNGIFMNKEGLEVYEEDLKYLDIVIDYCLPKMAHKMDLKVWRLYLNT